jgi:dTDP-4-dehydrorhamnose reductase
MAPWVPAHDREPHLKSSMILLLGSSGYLGTAFATELRKRGLGFTPLTRQTLDYTRFDQLFRYVRDTRPSFVINAAGYTGGADVDACRQARAESVRANALLPQTVARVCCLTNIPWGHVSSGSIYSGAKVQCNGGFQIQRDLDQTDLQRLFAAQPDRFQGFDETDEPNFSFRSPPCHFYSGTKALGEEGLRSFKQGYLWRPQAVFDEMDHPRNFLSHLVADPAARDSVNSFSHRGDFVRACLDLVQKSAPFGIYNIVNAGALTTLEIVKAVQRIRPRRDRIEPREEDPSTAHSNACTVASSCVLNTSKLVAAGIRLRSSQDAIKDSLENWRPSPHNPAWPENNLRDPAINPSPWAPSSAF